jgi:hypothetical protein
MLALRVSCKNTYSERCIATLLSVFVDPGAGVTVVDRVGFLNPPEDASRAMTPTGVFGDGGAAMDGDARVSDNGSAARLRAIGIRL